MKEKILLLNQHSSNHGDEAAGKALISNLKKIQNKYKFSILYNTISEEAIIDFNINMEKTLLTKKIDNISKILILLSFYLPIGMLSILFPKTLKDEYNTIKDNDIIINMPGGANLGLYNDWRYLWRLYVALKLKKKIAIYSTSIGPFSNKVFKKITFYVLKNVDFLSLRDAQSHRYADKEKLNYIKSIDTAFLVQPYINKFDLKKYGIPFKEKSYKIFVPNNLTAGHISFSNIDPIEMENFYITLMEKIISKDSNIVLLPQLFANGNDKQYFLKLISKIGHNEKIFVVDEKFSSDIQQNIIKRSSGVIGARYHSIIFAINAQVPFICLSYENKMKNTLEILNYTSYGLDLTDITKGKTITEIISQSERLIENLYDNNIVISNADAIKIAKNCYAEFKNIFLKAN